MKTYDEVDKLFNDFFLKLNEFSEPFKKDFNPTQISFSMMVHMINLKLILKSNKLEII